MTNIVVPNTVTNIGAYAFSQCRGLQSFTFPEGVSRIQVRTFEQSGLTNLLLPKNITAIDDYAFAACLQLKSVDLGCVSRIGAGIFLSCTNLTEVAIPEGITNITENTFLYCRNLARVNLPSSATAIGSEVFYGCTKLPTIRIPRSVGSVGIQAFGLCGSLTNVIIADTVTNLLDRAFVYCTNLAGVYCEGIAPSTGSDLFYGASDVIVYYLPRTPGWGQTFGGRPTALWLPQLNLDPTSFSIHNGELGFTIHWASSMTMVVEACTILSNAVWAPVSTNTITTDGTSRFTDPQWQAYPARFYRARHP